VRRRELTPLELVDAAIARIERVNPAINAVITPLFEGAQAVAVSRELPSGPFRGVPFLLKDLGAMQKGQPYYLGNRALRDLGFRSPFDTPLGARFRAAGFITLGKTNLPEFGMQTTTQPLAFGATHNPWDLDRSTSGSSGGSCAAVAAGMVPVAHANDGGGSIRLPAAWPLDIPDGSRQTKSASGSQFLACPDPPQLRLRSFGLAAEPNRDRQARSRALHPAPPRYLGPCG
jgi:amidase